MYTDDPHTRKCNSTVRDRNSLVMPKLNMQALEQLNERTMRSEAKKPDEPEAGSPSPMARVAAIREDNSPLISG